MRCAFRLGHTDGYPRKAVEGGKVLIGSRAYPVIGAVSASHTIVEVESDPNRLSAEAGVSIYDIFMHLNPTLPHVVV